MTFKIAFTPDEAYYKEAYEEIISSLKWKKYEPLFAIIMIIVGIVYYFLDKKRVLNIFPIFFFLMGFYELFKVYYSKRKWIKDRLSKKVVGQLIELEFNDTKVKHKGIFSSGEFDWRALFDIIKTKRGILLKPEKGISIYLPNKYFSSGEEIEFIISKKV